MSDDPTLELQRLVELSRYEITDTLPEVAYDEIAALAALLCGTPRAYVTFVDAERVWFKAALGAEVKDVPIAASICPLLVAGRAPLVIVNTLADERTRGIAAVTEGGLRFYAGVPLATPAGHVLGSLCVADTEARELTPEHLRILAVLGRQVVAHLELRRHALELAATVARERAANGRLLFLAGAAERLSLGENPGLEVAAMCRELARQLGAEVFLQYEPEEGGEHLQLVASGGLDAETEMRKGRLGMSEELCARSAREQRRIVVADARRSEDAGSEMLRGLGLNVYACHPLLSGGTLLGTLSFASAHREAWEAEDLELMRTVCGHLSIALHRARGVELQVRQAAALQESAERYRLLAETTAQQSRIYETTLASGLDFQYVFGLDGRLLYANRPLLALLGQSMEMIFGKNFHDLQYPVELASRLHRQIDQVIATGHPVRDETPFASHMGMRAYEYIFTPVFTDEGQVEAVAGVTRDITERKEAEEALSEQAAALREADRRKDEFLAMLAHELRNPLAAIRNAAALLGGAEDEPGTNAWAGTVIVRQTGQLAHLVDDLLDVSRITRGRITLRSERVDAARILEHALETVRPLFQERAHRVTSDFSEGVLWVQGDPSRLEQIIVNLLTNAAKYTESGGHIQVAGRIAPGGREVIIEVRDNGTGIPPEKLPEMWELFAQGDRHLARSEGGLGIGLTIVRALAELHGGRVEAQSEGAGHGSTFSVWLPLVEAREALPAVAVPAPAEAGFRKVLVVDDNVDTAQALRRLLVRAGFTVEVAFDGLAALDAARAFRPEVLLLDLGLPGMDGFELAGRLREEACCAEALLIAISGYGQEEDLARSRAVGFDHHLVKPVDFAELKVLLSGRPAPLG